MLVTLLPGRDREDVAKALQAAQFAANDVRNQRGELLVNGYITWVTNSVRQLRSRVSAADADRLVLTQRCWMLQSLIGTSGASSTLVNSLIYAELDERINELEAAHTSLQEQIKRWWRHGAFVVADTSVYIEDPAKIEDLDFRPLVEVRETPIHLLVPIVVVDELDGLKQSGRSQSRWRAGYSLAVFDKRFARTTGSARLQAEDYTPLQHGGIPRGEVTVEIVLDPPGHRRLPINDDEIVDRTLAIQALAGRPVTLITYDTGQALRARTAGLRDVKLSKPLEPEPTP